MLKNMKYNDKCIIQWHVNFILESNGDSGISKTKSNFVKFFT